MPVEFLSDEQAAAHGSFVGTPSRAQLARFFFLDDEDRRLVDQRQRDHLRLGFGVSIGTVRCVGRFLADPIDVPAEVVDYVAEQLRISDPSCIKTYAQRESTRREHAGEIQRTYRYRDFSTVADEFEAGWTDAWAWTTGDGPKALFDAAVGWLRKGKVLLPGVTTLARLVAGCMTTRRSGCGRRSVRSY
ncbi:DUF4158 domain-containing protein [Candidatus Protofrankia californiensis]|uniref:DUF4158 domain-containing protein n=1 Tax=Candidatus Protofrankia californiensis TaxID=1839754 RepID=UPI001040F66A|nr:DUF4158 domain-containing protein [Candidatus Protofrankia californiensis]